jgi:hypothetical protein
MAVVGFGVVLGSVGEAQAVQINAASIGGWSLLSDLNSRYSCYDANYGQGGTYMTATTATGYGGNRSAYSATCVSGHTSNAAGSVVTSNETLRAGTAQVLNLIGGRIAHLRMADLKSQQDPMTYSMNEDGSGGSVGLAAGGGKTRGIGLWVQGAFTHVDEDADAIKFDGHVVTGMAGIDYRFNNRLIVGLSAGYERSDIDTDFNNGDIESDGVIVAPYVSVRLTDVFSVDATGGYVWLDYEMTRKDAASVNWTGETDADRWFGALNANADWILREKWLVNANVGVLYSSEDKDAFTEKNTTANVTNQNIASDTTTLGQAVFGGRLGYDFGKVNPYLSLQGEYDFNKSSYTVSANQTKPEDDDFGMKVGLGANFNLTPNVSGMVEGKATLLREDYQEYTGVARVRLDF